MFNPRVLPLRIIPLLVSLAGCAKIIGIQDYNRDDAGGGDAPIDTPLGDAAIDAPFGATDFYVKPAAPTAGDQFGRALALSGDGATLVVGAPFEDSATLGINTTPDELAQSSGAAYVYTRSGGTWAQQAYLKASNTEAVDFFAYSVAVSADGNTVAVAAERESSDAVGIGGDQTNNNAPAAGAVYIFVRTGTTWTQQAYVKASNTGAGDQFGDGLALSGDGNTLAVGATFESSDATGINGVQTNDNAVSSGAVYVFTRAGTTWTQQAYVKAANAQAGDLFGQNLALSFDGGTLAVGATGEDSATFGINSFPDELAVNSGAVYVFVRAGVTWLQQAYIKASNTETLDNFGVKVSLSGNGSTLAVGANGEDSINTGVNAGQADNTASSAGAAYVFVRNVNAWSQQAYVKASNTDTGDQFGFSVAVAPDGSQMVVGAILERSNANGIGGNQLDNSAISAGAAYLFSRSGTTWSQLLYIKATNSDPTDDFGYAIAIAPGTVAAGAILEDSSAVGVNGDQNDNAAANSGAVYVYQ
jgi:hypothetical protein